MKEDFEKVEAELKAQQEANQPTPTDAPAGEQDKIDLPDGE